MPPRPARRRWRSAHCCDARRTRRYAWYTRRPKPRARRRAVRRSDEASPAYDQVAQPLVPAEQARELQRAHPRPHRVAGAQEPREHVDAQDVVEREMPDRGEGAHGQPGVAHRVREPAVEHRAGGEERDEERGREERRVGRAVEPEQRHEHADPESVGGEHHGAEDDAGAEGLRCQRFSTSGKLHHVKSIATRIAASNSAPLRWYDGSMHELSQALASPAAWEEPDRAARLAPRLPEETGLAARDAEMLLRLCEESADPDGALAGAVRALGARRARLGRPASAAALAPLVTICAASRYLAAHLAAQPRLIDLLPLLAVRTRTAQEALAAATRHANAPDAEALARRLRRHKLVEVLRIALRDLGGNTSLPESARELSWLAASLLEAAVRFHYARLCTQHGPPEGRTPLGPSGFCVLGMGKLGGTELNFSSDVDLLYVYERDGRTQGPQAIDHFAFYARLAEEVTRAIGATPFVFRVDLDLRPEGRSGPIVNSLRALELYYEAQGAPWERFALLKALPIAGDLEVGEDGLRRLAPFVWRKYLDLGAVEEMRALKARAEREAGRRGKQDLKLGPGGIREVEFFVQALQLLHGGKDANLRARGTLPALERLLFAGLISSRDRDELAEAYVFLRRLEHRLQMVAERQTHALPDDPAERARLARRAGYPGTRDEASQALDRDLQLHRGRVEARFRDLLRVAGGGAPAADPNATLAADPQAEPEERLQALRTLGFLDAEASAAELARLARRRETPFSPAAPPDLQQLAPRLVQEAAAAPDPDQALRHLADLFGQLSNPRAISELLLGSPRTARLLLSLFGSSDFLSRSLLRHPELIDQLVHRGSAPLVRAPEELRAELRGRLTGDAEHDLTELRRFRLEELLRIGVHDVAGALDADLVPQQLSDVAEACVAACLEL
ncbi:MAG: hypothetical protein E6J64_15285, partial [Deltaproteobacteria bacterium]